MKLQILQENLSKALNIASRFSSGRVQLPILGNILLSSKKTKLTISSTNLEISVSIQVGAKIEEEGDLSVPSKVITELIGNLPHETLDLETSKEQLKVSTSGFSSTVLGMNPNDFPKIPTDLPKSNVVSLPLKDFSSSLSQVIFATSVDETRPILTGVLLVLSKNDLILVATDGFRLSQKKTKISGGYDVKIVLPKLILSEISKMEEGDNVEFSVENKEKQAVFGTEDLILSSRLLDGEFPDYEKIIPKSSTYKISIDKEEFLRAVKLASIFARDSANIVKIKVFKDSLKLLAESGQSGNQEAKVEAKVDCNGEISEPFEIGFNYKYLEDFLHSVRGEEISMEFSNATAAGIFRDSQDSSYFHLIMPVRVQG